MKSPDIIEQIITSSGVLIATCDLGEIAKHTRILVQLTSQLIQKVNWNTNEYKNWNTSTGSAGIQTDPDLQVNSV